MKLKQIILDDLADKLAPAKVSQTDDVIIIQGAGIGYTFVFNSAGELLNVINTIDWDIVYRILVKTYTIVNQACSMNLSMEVSRND